MIENIKDGDESQMMIGYMGKMFAYFGRFVMICAICRNPVNPVIDDICIFNAEKIYNYFRYEAKNLLVKINDEANSNLTENESKLLSMLPDKFSITEAKEISVELKLSETFFSTAFNRKYKNGYITRGSGKIYEKVMWKNTKIQAKKNLYFYK